MPGARPTLSPCVLPSLHWKVKGPVPPVTIISIAPFEPLVEAMILALTDTGFGSGTKKTEAWVLPFASVTVTK